jgi:predicted kinase
VRKHLGQIPLSERGGDDLYTPQMTQRTYARLLHLGVTLASQGFPVILDAKYDRKQLREEAIALAQKHQIPIQIIYCTAPEGVLRSRLDNRTSDIADATANLLASQIEKAEAFSEQEKPLVKFLDTTQPLEAQLEEVICQ